MALALGCSMAACSDDKKNDEPNPNEPVESKDLEYTASNANAWHNYTIQVANLLKDDANSLYEAWATSYDGGDAYATTFITTRLTQVR